MTQFSKSILFLSLFSLFDFLSFPWQLVNTEIFYLDLPFWVSIKYTYDKVNRQQTLHHKAEAYTLARAQLSINKCNDGWLWGGERESYPEGERYRAIKHKLQMFVAFCNVG